MLLHKPYGAEAMRDLLQQTAATRTVPAPSAALRAKKRAAPERVGAPKVRAVSLPLLPVAPAPTPLPDQAFLPFWVDGAGYWLIVMGEPLLSNPALIELLWSLKQAGTRFATIG